MAREANNPSQFGTALGEGVWVCLAAVVFALAANALSPRGLSLTRDYFPRAQAVAGDPANDPGLPEAGDEAAVRLAALGLQVLTHTNAVRLFQDPGYVQGDIVFLDARNETQYKAGHIPGAQLFDHYRAPQYLPSVLAVCLSAGRIVVYCGGGECEDSEFAAIILRDAGVPVEKILVYADGFRAWKQAGLPVEVGARNSGHRRNTAQ